MRVTEKSLENLNRKYRGYLRGNRLDAFFEEFGIKFAAGHWCAGDFADRFAPVGYNSDDPAFDSGIVAQIERVALAGIQGIEFHEQVFIDRKYKKDPAKVESVREALDRYHVTPTNMNTNLFTDPKWKLGGVTNANRSIRQAALRVALQGVEIAKEVGCKSVSLWPGSDGWDYNFEVNYGEIFHRFLDACVRINTKAKKLGLRFGIEAKLHEPREGNMVVATTHKAMLVAKYVNEKCGGKNMGVCIDYGHEQMYCNEPADNLYVGNALGVPIVNFHVNNAKTHSNDEDRVTGTGDNWRFVDFCYAAIDTGYDGWFGEDQFTYRMEPVKAMALSKELFGNLMKKALLIYARRDRLRQAQATGDAARTIDVVKDILL